MLAACALPAGASAAPGWTYLWADQPSSTAGYAPDPASQASSAGVLDVVEHNGVAPGSYTVGLRGLADPGGTVSLSAYGADGPVHCLLDGIEPTAARDLKAGVECTDASGAPIDSRFELAFTRPRAGSTGRFAYAAGGADGSGTPIVVPKRYTFNSTGKGITVVRSDPGVYRVDLAGLASDGGTVHVTALLGDAPRCAPVSWHRQGTAERIFVVCFAHDGTVADGAFMVTFADRTNLLGVRSLRSAYAWANQPSAASYRADAAHAYNSAGGRASVTRSATGAYAVLFPGQHGPGNVQVNATGGPGSSCQVTSVSDTAPGEAIGVACYAETGAPVDSAFVVQYARQA